MHTTENKTTISPGPLINNGPVKALFFQAKLTINTPGDQYEQEADRMAEHVMRMPMGGQPFFQPAPVSVSALQRKCRDCEEDKKIRRKEDSLQPTEASGEVSSYIGSLSSKGSPLPDSARNFFEPRFGQDFSNVKIHNDADAARSSQSVNALAYTVDNNIVFNQNQFSSTTDSGQRLLAHELTHVVQQVHSNIQRQPAPPAPQVTPSAPTSPPAHIVPPAPTQGSEFNKGAGFDRDNVIPSENPKKAADNNTIQVSAGDQLIFNLDGSDQDKKRFNAGQPWTEIKGKGPYEIDFAITGDAELDATGSGTTTKTIPSLNASNVMIFVKSSWNGTSGITVTATMKDDAPAIAPPATGDVKDADRVLTWTLIARKNPCPKSLKILSGQPNTWTPTSIQFTYQAQPDLPPAGRPDYEGQTLLETFGVPTALGFDMADLEPAYKKANPQLTSRDQVAAAIFSGVHGGSFVFDDMDTITDMHDRFGVKLPGPFTAVAYQKPGGVGWNLPQQYICGGKVIGSYLISRRISNANGLEVKKI